MFCKRCRYPLAQLTSRQCPECGRAFDADDPRTFLRKPRFPITQRFALIIHGGVLGMMLTFAVAPLVGSTPVMGREVVGALSLGALLFGGSILAAIGIAIADLPWLRERGLAHACLGMDCAAMSLWVWMLL